MTGNDEISLQPGLQSVLSALAQMDPLVDTADAVRTVHHPGDMETVPATLIDNEYTEEVSKEDGRYYKIYRCQKWC